MAGRNVQPRMARFGGSELEDAVVEPPRIDIRLAKLSREHLHLQRKNSSNARPEQRGIDLFFAYPPNLFEVHITRLRCATPDRRRPTGMCPRLSSADIGSSIRENGGEVTGTTADNLRVVQPEREVRVALS